MTIEAMKQLIEDVISMMEYHVEQTRPIHTTTVALQAAKDALKAIADLENQELVCVCGCVWEGQELVESPPPRLPLTDDERFQLRCQWNPEIHGLLHDYLIQQTEAAHGIKGEV